MKKCLKKGFLALALIFTLIGITTLKNNKIGAYAPKELITEFNTENLFSEFVVESIKTDDVYTTMIVSKIHDDYVEGIEVDLFYRYLLNLNGYEKYITELAFFPVENGEIILNTSFILSIDSSTPQQIISAYELNPSLYVFEPNFAIVEFAFMFFTPLEMGPISSDMLQGIGLYNYESELLYKPGGISDKGLNGIFDLINNPINDLFNYIGIDDTLIFSPGFGQITWFQISLRKFLKLVIAILIGLWFFKFILKLIKRFFSFIFGGFAL
jgi:hypothetical protein